MNQDNQKNHYHQVRMARKKAQIDAAIANAQDQKGLIIVLTGNGKGKSTSAFGMVARALGHGQKVGVCQFIKSRTDTGEEAFFKNHCDWQVLGKGFTWDTQNRQQDIDNAQQAWQVASQMLANPDYQLVVLDELTYLLSYQYLDSQMVISALQAKPSMQHIVITGRHANAELVNLADTVSDIKEVKHPFHAGIMAQAGIDF